MKYLIFLMMMFCNLAYADLDEVRVKNLLRDIRNDAMKERLMNEDGSLYYDGYIQATSDVMEILNFVKS